MNKNIHWQKYIPSCKTFCNFWAIWSLKCEYQPYSLNLFKKLIPKSPV